MSLVDIVRWFQISSPWAGWCVSCRQVHAELTHTVWRATTWKWFWVQEFNWKFRHVSRNVCERQFGQIVSVSDLERNVSQLKSASIFYEPLTQQNTSNKPRGVLMEPVWFGLDRQDESLGHKLAPVSRCSLLSPSLHEPWSVRHQDRTLSCKWMLLNWCCPTEAVRRRSKRLMFLSGTRWMCEGRTKSDVWKWNCRLVRSERL